MQQDSNMQYAVWDMAVRGIKYKNNILKICFQTIGVRERTGYNK